MRALKAYAVLSFITIFVLSFALTKANQRIATLERQLVAPAPAGVAVVQRASGSRTFKASNGVVLNADDLARIDADDRAAKAAAELEYYVTKPGSRR